MIAHLRLARNHPCRNVGRIRNNDTDLARKACQRTLGLCRSRGIVLEHLDARAEGGQLLVIGRDISPCPANSVIGEFDRVHARVINLGAECNGDRTAARAQIDGNS